MANHLYEKPRKANNLKNFYLRPKIHPKTEDFEVKLRRYLDAELKKSIKEKERLRRLKEVLDRFIKKTEEKKRREEQAKRQREAEEARRQEARRQEEQIRRQFEELKRKEAERRESDARKKNDRQRGIAIESCESEIITAQNVLRKATQKGDNRKIRKLQERIRLLKVELARLRK